MKNKKQCEKCNSKNIIKIPGKSGAYGTGNNIPIGLSVFGAVGVTRYLCPECGYLEEWIEKKEDVEKVIKEYK